MAIGFCGIRNLFLVFFFLTNLVSKEGSKDSNVPEDTNNDDKTVEDPTELSSDEDVNGTGVAEDDNEGISFLPHPKAKDDSKRDITVLERGDQTFFVCKCGFSSGSNSGASRHKCREANDVSFPCDVCGQVCKNPGSLKRHKTSKHGQNSSTGLFILDLS